MPIPQNTSIRSIKKWKFLNFGRRDASHSMEDYLLWGCVWWKQSACWLTAMGIPMWSVYHVSQGTGVYCSYNERCDPAAAFLVCFNPITIQKHVIICSTDTAPRSSFFSSLISHLSIRMKQRFPGTIWSYLGSAERVAWSFTSLVRQHAFFTLTLFQLLALTKLKYVG